MTPTRRHVALTGALGAALILGACWSAPVTDSDPDNTGEPVSDHGLHTGSGEYQPASLSSAPSTDDVVAAVTALGLTMVTTGPQGHNVVTSPASAAFALTMLTEGARGQTRTELEDLLGAEGEARTEAMSALQAALAAYEGDPADAVAEDLPEVPIAHVANNVVVDDNAAVHAAYLDVLTGAYDAGVQITDLASQDGKDVLDEWVVEHTGGLIESSAVEPDPDLFLVLQNAVLFAAQWEQMFPDHRTADRTFTTGSGEQVQVPSMIRTGDLAHAQIDGWQAVRLPYNEGFHADVLLPPEGTGPETIDGGILEAIDGALQGRAQELELFLPQVEVDSNLDLIPALQHAGVQTAFDDAAADFSGISDTALVVGTVQQQAALRLGEEGTVAAAVTEIGMDATSAMPGDEPPRMRVDRPFLFRITHTETGLPLFFALVADPRG